MKRILIFLVCICLLSLSLVGCKAEEKDDTIRLNEVTHSIFYAPQYIAMAKGYFADEGLKIELTNGGGADKSMTAILSNSADIGLMGPEAAIYVYLEGKTDYVQVVGQLTKRDGSFLIAREDIPNFNFENMEGKSVIMGRKGGVPAMTLQYVLNQKDYIDGQNITMRYDIDFNNTASAFIGGTGDYVALFEPTASDLVRNGKGYIVASVGAKSGEVPYTAYMAKKSYIEKNADKIEKFLRAVQNAMVYMRTATIDDLVTLLKPYFPGFNEIDIKDSLESYISIDAYMSNLVMTEASFTSLQDIMTNAGELTTRAEFSKLIDNSIATKVKK